MYLLMRLFSWSVSGFWFHILPHEEFDDDITYSTGVPWGYILPLLLETGLIKSIVLSDVKEIQVNYNKWVDLHNSFKIAMQVTYYQQRKSRREYFICFGKPLYKNPGHQLKLLEKPPSSKENSAEFFELKNQIWCIVTEILHKYLVERAQKYSEILGTNLPATDKEPNKVDELALSIEKQIDIALKLNLEEKPRLTRTTGGK